MSRSEAAGTPRSDETRRRRGSRREKPTKQEQQLKDLWDESTEGLSGKDAINAFRRAYQNPS